MVRLVGRGQDLGLVDEVHLEALEHLGLGEVPDAGLGHDGDGHDLLDAGDQLGVAHAGHATITTDVAGHALQGHDGHRTGVLGHLGLLGVDDVHDHAAAHHLGEAALDVEVALLGGRGGSHGRNPTGSGQDGCLLPLG